VQICLKKAEQTPKNLEIFMLIEHNAKILEKHQELLDENIHSQVMIKNLEEDLNQAEEKIEYLLNLTRKLNGNSN
jgi:Tfp pilus assembly protein PilN